MAQRVDTFGSRGTFNTGSGEAVIYRLSELAKRGIGHVDKLPYSIKILLENALRNLDNFEVSEDNVAALVAGQCLAACGKPVPKNYCAISPLLSPGAEGSER